MSQTDGTRKALLRDSNLCQYHLAKYGQQIDIFLYQPKRHHYRLAGGHHCFKRSRVDLPEAIIALCADCHGDVEGAKISKIEIVALCSKISGVDLYKKYPEFCKWTDEQWAEVYP